MEAEDPALLALVGAVCDGERIDWESASIGATESFRTTLAELRVLADLANLNRSLGGETDGIFESRAHATYPSPVVTPGAPRWGHLHLLEPIASGSFGDVYRAWDPAIDREVALKLLKPAGRDDRDAHDTIEEGRLLARVKHPNVVTIHGAARVEGRVGIWMEFIQGRTLAAIVQTDGPFEAHRTAAIGATVCEAVGAIHAARLLHRDIKAQNAMLADDGRVVLMDLGAGRAQDDTRRDMAGTPLYLAPEVLAGDPASVRSDVYSLGVLLHYLSTGTFPHADHLPRTGEVVGFPTGGPRSQMRADAPPSAIAGIIARATAEEPGARFESATEMGAALRALAPSAQPLRPSPRFLVIAVALAVAVGAASLPMSRALSGSSATPSRAPFGAAAADQEATRKLPWHALPTGPPSEDGRALGAVEWDHTTGAGLPVLVDLANYEQKRLWDPPKAEADAGGYALSSSIAPGGAHVAFAWYTPLPADETQIKVCSIGGTAARTVFRESAADGTELRVLGWSTAGTALLVLRGVPGGQADVMWIGIGDGHARHVLTLPTQPFASLNRNGRDLVLDWPQPGSPDKRDLVILDTLTAEVRPLLAEPANDAMPVWLPDGKRVLFASDRGGAFGAWLMDVTAGNVEPQQVRGTMGYWQPVGFGANDELYYIAQTGTVDVYTARVDAIARRVGERVPVATSFRGRNLFSDWAPDSRHLAFTSRRGAINFAPSSQYVVVRDLTSDSERVIPTPLADIGPICWSPDGRRIAMPTTGANGGLWVLTVATGASERAWASTGLIHSVAWPSADRVAFVVDTREGSVLQTLSLGNGQVTTLASGPSAVVASHSGHQLATLTHARDGFVVMVGDSEALRDARTVFRWSGPGRLQLAGWTPDDAFVVAVHAVAPGKEAAIRVIAIPVDGGAPITLGEAPLGGDARTVRLSPDGTMLSFEAGAPVLTSWVLEHPLFRH